MSQLSFNSFRDFFEYNFNKHSRDLKGAKTLTLQEFANKLGYKSPSLLSMIATGKRLPSSEILEELFEEWKVDSNQREIIRLRVEIEKRLTKQKPVNSLLEKLSKKDKKLRYETLEIDTFNSIKDWYNVILQMMVDSPQFKEDYVYLSYILRRKVSSTQIKKGIETLIKVGLIKRNQETGILEKCNIDNSLETPHDIPSEAIREHHKGMISRALEAVDDLPISERHLNSLTLKFNNRQMPEAKKAIIDFVKEFNERFHDNNSNDIKQLNIQFFGHTQFPNTDLSPEDKIQ